MEQVMSSFTSKARFWLRTRLERPRFRRIASTYDIQGHKRIYHFHIRKTAGISLLHSFFALSGADPAVVLNTLENTLPTHRALFGDKIYLGWNPPLIREGDYFFAFSHFPMQDLTLPPDTFTLTCFRDPAERVISHYRMLIYFRNNKIDHDCMKTEAAWLKHTFDDFLDRVPKEHLLNQLYMFSKDYNVDEACARIAGLNQRLFLDRFDEGLARLRAATGLDLQPFRTNVTGHRETIADASIHRLREMLEPEYDLLEKVKKLDPPS